MLRMVYLVATLLVVLWASAGCQLQPKELKVLCSANDSFCEAMALDYEKQTGIKINFLRLSTNEALDRIRQSKDSPEPEFDLWWGGPSDSYLVAKAEGLFLPYDSPNLSNLASADYYDPEHYWAGTYFGAIAIGVNTNWLEANPEVKFPETWEDLLQPEFTGQIAIPHPVTSGTGYTFLAAILQLKGEEEGWEYMRQLGKQLAFVTKAGVSPADFVTTGEANVGIAFGHHFAQTIQENKAPIRMIYPTNGTGFEIAGLAILKGTPRLELAQQFYDWLLSHEAQESRVTHRLYEMPTVKGVNSLSPVLDTPLIRHDALWAAENKDLFVQKFINEVASDQDLR